ncbi:FAD-binding oxidoreductase [Spiribacter halobius]|uniref:FAD-linked oxidase n=1 Tax=Sediminicurvatus halobius TaxID=2182432 RepID=A0A2U2N880_9GAMM|nr:FAD-binding oxidoreductase [Spiribacter halobius]PWG65375.1 FAD-linked oxidase [Spiribacter halobius]UEX76392.1 FAD-binding oxidoreductase [Spiribacter halobius]
MNSYTFRTLDGGTTTVDAPTVDAFAGALRGDIVAADHPGYDEARAVWNGMVDRHPTLIARCRGARDVQTVVRFAAEHGLLTSVRGGGHHIAGNAVADQGLVIDCSAMRDVHVDPERRSARVGPGALLADFDHEAQAFGLATPLGINSTTGVAGLCLGGGFGWLSRRYGMTIDNLVSADLVTADGERRTVSGERDPELLWALQGGGGNFGVVTAFEFRLHPVGPMVYSGLVVYPFAQAEQVLRAWRDFTATAPEALTVWTVLRKAPPLPFLPESVHGHEVVVFPLVHCGDPADGERAAAPVLGFGEPVGSALGIQPYAAFQQAFDPLLTPGGRNYWKSNSFSTLNNAVLDLVINAAATLPDPECEVFIAHVGGAMARVAPTDTAYAGRDAHYIMNVHGRWSRPEQDDAVRDWARRTFSAAAPHGTGGGYVNFLTEDEGERTQAAYGVNYARLQAVKQRVDPRNLFRSNLNIPPQAPEAAA